MDYHSGMELAASTTTIDTLGPTETQAITAWLTGLQSPNTRAAYRSDLRLFVEWVDAQGGTLRDITAAGVEAWQAERLTTDSPATVARRVAAVSSFYRWSSRPGRWLAGHPNPASADMITRTAPSSTPAPALTTSEVGQLITAARTSKHARRDTALVVMLATTGIRVSELCGASNGDIRTTQGMTSLVVTGKGRTRRTVPITPTLADLLDLDRPNTAPLITDNNGERLNRKQVQRALARLGKAAGINHLTPHALRATMITEALADGAPLWAVQDIAGHADPRTTRGYQRRAQTLTQGAALAASLYARYDNTGQHQNPVNTPTGPQSQ